ncbi:MAG: hypothetical protein KDA96_15415 [Planctomycetaceae bacterium]|nr:hypothetical protein [Planctomycetaceae bacterium]
MNPDFSELLSRYQNHGVIFDYPGFWKLHEEQDDSGEILITVAVDETAFWMLRILPACPPPSEVVHTCVAAFEDEYEDVEHTHEHAQLAQMPASASEVSFSCHDLLNTAWLSAVRISDFTVLVWWQGTDHELEEHRRVFEFMTASVRIRSLLD